MKASEQAMEKKALRNARLESRDAKPAAERDALDRAICEHIVRSSLFDTAQTILLYYPVKGEINLLAVAKTALTLGKHVAFPRVRARGEMTFHYVMSLGELSPASFGIPEPHSAAPKYEGEPALCLAPALCCDKDGYRLGYGGGYFDRFLPTLNGVSLGASYDADIVDMLPREGFDRPLDGIVTESGIKMIKE